MLCQLTVVILGFMERGGMWAWTERESSFWRFSMVSALLVFSPTWAGNIEVSVHPVTMLYFVFWIVGFGGVF